MDITELFAALDGTRIPGGCESCDAYQEPTQADDGFLIIRVCHDDDCPVLARNS